MYKVTNESIGSNNKISGKNLNTSQYHAHVLSCLSSPALCASMDYSLAGSPVHGILQARILDWVAMPSSRGSSQSRDQILISCVFCLAGRFFAAELLGMPTPQ